MLKRRQAITLEAVTGYPLPEGVNYNVDSNACFSVSIAYIMYRIGADRRLWHPRAIDQLTHRRPGETTDSLCEDRGLLALLDQGASLSRISDFNEARFAAEGRAYLDEYHARGWLAEDPRGYNAYHHPSRVEQLQVETNRVHHLFNSYGNAWQDIVRAPTQQDFETLIPGHLIETSIRGGVKRSLFSVTTDPSIEHSVVVVDHVPDGQAQDNGTDTGWVKYFSTGPAPYLRESNPRFFNQSLTLPVTLHAVQLPGNN